MGIQMIQYSLDSFEDEQSRRTYITEFQNLLYNYNNEESEVVDGQMRTKQKIQK